MTARAVVLVEGLSDKLAVEALAERRGRNLADEHVTVVPMGGSKNFGSLLQAYLPNGVKLAGLVDVGEEGDFRRALERAGFGDDLTREEMERLGFYVCDADLEDELIRALGPDAVERVIEELGDLESFRTFKMQPAWRGRPVHEQFRRFFGTTSGRKARSAPRLVAALDLVRVPRPLDGVLAHV
jgi:hypothetical protein